MRFSQPPDSTPSTELAVCRSIAARCCFVMGYARSGTTVLADVINSNERALITGEAHYFVPNDAPRFRDWFNAQHTRFGNQITKLTHAPDFIPDANHTWWQWLVEAAAFFEVVGDKVGLSDYFLSLVPPAAILSFYQSRFFNARYVFTIRNPLDTLVSAALKFNRDTHSSLRDLLRGWLVFVQLWADFVRVFPYTQTIIFDHFDIDIVDRLSAFVGLDLSPAKAFLVRPTRSYDISALTAGSALEPYQHQLAEIFANIINAASGDTVRLRRSAQRADDPERPGCERAWILAEQALDALHRDQP